MQRQHRLVLAISGAVGFSILGLIYSSVWMLGLAALFALAALHISEENPQ